MSISIQKESYNAKQKEDNEINEQCENQNAEDKNSDVKYESEYMEVLEEISNNANVYKSYIKLTNIAYKLHDILKIRQSYKIFSEVYPVSSTLWLRYIQTEKGLATTQSDILRIEDLIKKALKDYYSSNIALEFADIALKSPNAEKIWDEILATYSLDVMEGRKFFALYRNFNALQDYSPEQKNNNVIKSYINELAQPLYKMEESYIDFKVYCEKNQMKSSKIVDWEKLDSCYRRAQKILSKILPYEKSLKQLCSKSYSEKAQIYEEYIKNGNKYVDKHLLQTIYERMVTDCCLNENCWINYVEFLEKLEEKKILIEQKKFPIFLQSSLEVNSRALKNCIASEKLFIQRIRILERLKAPKSEIKEVLEKALEIGFSYPEQYVSLWMEYLTYLRRNTDYEDEQQVQTFRKNFELCWDTLGKQWGDLADCDCEILQFWGQLEYGHLCDSKKGKELWTTVMGSSDNSLKSNLWIQYINLEIKRDHKSARKIFQKALQIPKIDNPYAIASTWLLFERCNGTITQLSFCQEFCKNTLKKYESERTFFTNFEEKKSSSKRKLNEKSIKLPPFKKTKIYNKEIFRQHENELIDFSKDNRRIFISNLDFNIVEEDIRCGLPEIKITNIDLIKNINGKNKGYCYVELSSEDEVKKALQLDRKMLNGRPLFVSSVLRDKEKREKFKYSEDVEPKKIFVKGIPLDTTKEELHSLFQSCGEIADLRIVTHKNGKPKGIAFIEFKTETEASLAVIKLDNFKLRDCEFSVSISAPPPKSLLEGKKIPTKVATGSSILNKGNRKTIFNFIPIAVRKNSNILPEGALHVEGNSKKSNEDFRKLLQKI